jgi:hypothetical protein
MGAFWHSRAQLRSDRCMLVANTRRSASIDKRQNQVLMVRCMIGIRV